ncbi:primosomal protein N' [Psychrobacter sanguinis]|uniref:primosomal protein N' n=1 Tax=Psychrobacter sanguinis TaxID=861445 RepID=UPI00020C79A9|nr:primosomal protein N' [Psychrobacter sanguinis]EGK14583.1 primosome assembly protein PriA [Psychrobacter sp. 1501(2011)]MCD9150878.1 primosomal protein N' [Psychrobacter sanguinis]
MLIRVALPVPLYREFDYLPNSNNTNSANTLTDAASNVAVLPPIGGRVQVSFGRQTLIGIVVDHIDSNQSDVPLNKLKAIKQVIDTAPILDLQMLSLARWLASYYHYPLGDVLSVMLPTLIRQGKPLDMLVTHWRILPNVSEDDFHSNAHKQKQQFAMLKLHGEHGASEDTLLLEGMERPFLKRLEDNGLIEHFLEEQAAPRPVTLAKMPLTLNEQQQQAVDKIVATAKQAKYGGFLLNGVTGSGKTEVYLQAMQAILEAGKQVLVLVPEIGLTPQTRARFAARFAANILLLHSGLNVTQRLHGWEDCRQGRAQIIIGTRSSILHPFADLGLIVVDESHDQSYKQQDTLRYHAADVALYRGYQLDIPVVLGTATPSLEHLKLVQDGKLTELLLTQRAGNAKEATMQLVDARDTPTKYSDSPAAPTQQASLLPNLKGSQNTGLTDDTIVAIRETLEAGEQVLVFLNRRGYAPILLCEACGWQADCVRCEAHMTVHHSQLNTQQPSYLKCHHCDWQASIPLACPDCASVNLNAVGMGTTRLTESLHALFSNPQTSKKTYPIIQIDRDTTRKKDSWEDIYRRINSGNPAILVGTQMVAKGHHFPNVTLVCLPNADRGFLSPDFRSPEHTAQLIVQVAGRSGRGSKPGKVLIQTVQPENPLLRKLVRDGYQPFALELLKERKMLGLPPYTYGALIRCEAKTLQQATQVLKDAIAIMPPHELAILGPIDAPMKMKNSRYHSQLLLLSKQRPQLHQLLNFWWPQVLQLPSAKYLKLTLDVDPIGW